MKVTAAQLLTRLLADSGVRIVAGIPGNTVFSFANAVGDEPRLFPLLVRNEATASFAADVYFRVSGQLMAVMCHALPGSACAVPGVANAYADSSAMVVVAGEIARGALGRGAYQELSRGMDGDTAQLLRHVSKRAWQAHDPLQLVEQALRAIRLARSGRPGPVVLSVFHDVWDQEVDVPSLPRSDGFLLEDAAPRPPATAVARAAALLQAAERPLILAGNGVNLARSQDALVALAERLNAPVATTVTGKGAFPEDHRLSLGVIGWFGTACANWAGREADVVLSIGARLTEAATSSWQPGISFAFGATKLIQADVEPAEVATVYPVEVALIGDARHTLLDLAEALDWVAPRTDWEQRLGEAKRQWQVVVQESAAQRGSPVPVGPVVQALRRATEGQELTIVCDVGKHLFWLVQQFEARRGDMVVSTMGGGTMGFGPCGAIGAALGRPTARTIAWIGDGGLSLAPYALPTAAEYRLPIVFVVVDDRSYSTIANLQLQRFNRTVFSRFDGSGTNPEYALDLARLAEACGVPSRRVTAIEEVAGAIDWALAQEGPVLLDVLADPTSMIPASGGAKLPDIWAHPIYPWAQRPSPVGAH